MKRFFRLAAILLVAVAFSGHMPADKQAKNDTIMVLGGKKVLVKKNTCTKKHKNGCHNGGPYSTKCSIDNSYYPCLGAIGGGCEITCRKGAYACCGKECRCVPNPEPAKKK